jgi:hypothetical protein
VDYSTDAATAVLTVEQMEWREAYDSMKVDFGVTYSSPYGQYAISGIRSHDSLRRRLVQRQALPSSTISFPSAPSITPTSSSTVHDISFSNFNPEIVPLGDITIGCKNCSMVGTLEITQGTFTVNSSTINEFDEARQFIEHGFFGFVGNGISAHIELDTLVTLTASFEGAISTTALPGFQVSTLCSAFLFP